MRLPYLHVCDLVLLPMKPFHLVLFQLQPRLHILIIITLWGNAPGKVAALARLSPESSLRLEDESIPPSLAAILRLSSKQELYHSSTC